MSVAMDRLKASFNALVKAATARLPYAAPRFARVVKATTAADGSTTLDVVAEDPAFQVPGGVPLFHGLPAVSLTLAKGTRVLVEFSEADPAKPFVRSWAGGETITALSISGGQPAARVGDDVSTILNPADIGAIAASMIGAGLVLPGSPTAAPVPVPITGENVIASGSAVISLG